jgi:hypothetical protein
VSELTELMLKEKAACESRTPQLIELFVGRLGDNNAKVAALALQGMEKVHFTLNPKQCKGCRFGAAGHGEGALSPEMRATHPISTFSDPWIVTQPWVPTQICVCPNPEP